MHYVVHDWASRKRNRARLGPSTGHTAPVPSFYQLSSLLDSIPVNVAAPQSLNRPMKSSCRAALRSEADRSPLSGKEQFEIPWKFSD